MSNDGLRTNASSLQSPDYLEQKTPGYAKAIVVWLLSAESKETLKIGAKFRCEHLADLHFECCTRFIVILMIGDELEVPLNPSLDRDQLLQG